MAECESLNSQGVIVVILMIRIFKRKFFNRLE